MPVDYEAARILHETRLHEAAERRRMTERRRAAKQRLRRQRRHGPDGRLTLFAGMTGRVLRAAQGIVIASDPQRRRPGTRVGPR